MATLSKANMVTGNTITAADVTQLVDAFTSGGGYSVSISGSLTGSSSTSITANTASYVEGSNVDGPVTTANTSSYVTTLSDQQSTVAGNPTVDVDLKFVAGSAILTSGTVTTPSIPVLAGKSTGVNAFITMNYWGASAGFPLTATIGGAGDITFTELGGATNERINFIVAYF